MIRFKEINLLPLCGCRERCALTISGPVSTSDFDQQGFEVSDRLPRLGRPPLSKGPKLLCSVSVCPSKDHPKSVPGEPSPLILVVILSVVPKPYAYSSVGGKTDVVGAMVIMKNVDPSLIPYIAHLELRLSLIPPPKNTEPSAA